jgi:hypothetical protein
MKVKILYWLPRILCILAILFLSMFALDSFSGNDPFGTKILAFLIHLVPSYVLIALTIVAWKWENVGGILLIVTGIIGGGYLFTINYGMNHSYWISLGIYAMLALPFIIAGILFLWSYSLRNKNEVSG